MPSQTQAGSALCLGIWVSARVTQVEPTTGVSSHGPPCVPAARLGRLRQEDGDFRASLRNSEASSGSGRGAAGDPAPPKKEWSLPGARARGWGVST